MEFINLPDSHFLRAVQALEIARYLLLNADIECGSISRYEHERLEEAAEKLKGAILLSLDKTIL